MRDFWSPEENVGKNWNGNDEIQAAYYDFLHEVGFIYGNANNKPKDAREKTSGLVSLGLIDDNRRLKEVGKQLLNISERNVTLRGCKKIVDWKTLRLFFVRMKMLSLTTLILNSLKDASEILDRQRYIRLNHLIDSKFTDEQILNLLTLISDRADDEIQKPVTDNADIPTIFEYIFGILRYKVSERQGKILLHETIA